jgi:two-component system response regulator DevR
MITTIGGVHRTMDGFTDTPTTDRPISVLICDDHDMVREALAALVERETDLKPVTCGGTVDAAITALERTPVDVAVLDVNLEHGSGIDVARWVNAHQPTCRTLILTSFPNDRVIVDSYEAGVRALVLKGAPANQLVESIRDIHAGLRLLDSLTARAARYRLGVEPEIRVSDLDPVDRTILDMLADGSTDREIAEEVHLNVQTIRNRVSRLLTRFGKANRTQLAVMVATMPG